MSWATSPNLVYNERFIHPICNYITANLILFMYLSKSQMFYRCSTFPSAWFPQFCTAASASLKKTPSSCGLCSLLHISAENSSSHHLSPPLSSFLSSFLSFTSFSFSLLLSVLLITLLLPLLLHMAFLSPLHPNSSCSSSVLIPFLSIHHHFPPSCPPPLSSSLSSLLSQSAVTEILQAHSDRDLFHCFLCRQLAVLTISWRIKCYLTLLAGRSSLYTKRKNLKAICFSYENDPLTLWEESLFFLGLFMAILS